MAGVESSRFSEITLTRPLPVDTHDAETPTMSMWGVLRLGMRRDVQGDFARVIGGGAAATTI